MNKNQDITQGKSISELGWEAFWFLTHTSLAFIFLILAIGAITLTHPNADALQPKLLGTALAFMSPWIGGFLIARSQQNHIASYVWISGLVVFSVVCVWVLNLPTGNGLCETCGAVEKLWRTFFDIRHGSGLMAGDGLFAGTWIPLSMIGYAFGAWFGLEPDA